MDPCDCEGLQTRPRWAVAHDAQTPDTWNEAQLECTPWMLLITNETTLPGQAFKWERMWDEWGLAIPPSFMVKSTPGKFSIGILGTGKPTLIKLLSLEFPRFEVNPSRAGGVYFVFFPPSVINWDQILVMCNLLPWQMVVQM